MVIASWNVNSLRVRLPQVLDWLKQHQPDMLALQETKLPDDQFPVEQIHEAGYQVSYAGQKTYNGVAILSKKKQHDPLTDAPGLDDAQRRILAATIDGVRLLNLYVVNGQQVGSDKYAWKLHWLEKVTDFIAAQIKLHEKFVVVGDFNITPTDADTWDADEWKDKILCSAPERAALQRLFDLGLTDTFRLFEQPPDTFSWWDYRAGSFRRNHGLRIDLILCSEALRETCTASYIDKAPRRLQRPSDHTPVVAEFA